MTTSGTRGLGYMTINARLKSPLQGIYGSPGMGKMI
jgi:hypothetical protein